VSRWVVPLVFVLGAGLVYFEGHDGDAGFYLFPYLERLPMVGDDPVARADASAALLLGIAGLLVLRTLLRSRRSEEEA